MMGIVEKYTKATRSSNLKSDEAHFDTDALAAVALSSDMSRTWPRRVWKHYYAMPADIWTDTLLDAMPSPASGILLLREKTSGVVAVEVKRAAKPDRNADKISPEAAIDIARLASLRMWESFIRLDRVAA